MDIMQFINLLSRMTFRFVFALAVLAVPVWSYSAGAPEGACGDMVPQHHVAAQTSPAPYAIAVSKQQIRSGESVQVTISGQTQKDTIKGFLVQARVGQAPVGQFDVAPTNPYIQTLNCGNGKAVSIIFLLTYYYTVY